MCESCIHYVHIVKDQRSSQNEVATFQNVFSQLPDEIKRYIGEFVPNVFKYIEVSTRLFYSHSAKFSVLEKYAELPKPIWDQVKWIIYRACFYIPGSVRNRKQICSFVLDLYKTQYAK
jgi:hypothetical protein